MGTFVLSGSAILPLDDDLTDIYARKLLEY